MYYQWEVFLTQIFSPPPRHPCDASKLLDFVKPGRRNELPLQIVNLCDAVKIFIIFILVWQENKTEIFSGPLWEATSGNFWISRWPQRATCVNAKLFFLNSEPSCKKFGDHLDGISTGMALSLDHFSYEKYSSTVWHVLVNHSGSVIIWLMNCCCIYPSRLNFAQN